MSYDLNRFVNQLYGEVNTWYEYGEIECGLHLSIHNNTQKKKRGLESVLFFKFLFNVENHTLKENTVFIQLQHTFYIKPGSYSKQADDTFCTRSYSFQNQNIII